MYTFNIHLSVNNQYYWNLVASNGQKVATAGERFTTKSACVSSINLVKNNANAPVIDHTIKNTARY